MTSSTRVSRYTLLSMIGLAPVLACGSQGDGAVDGTGGQPGSGGTTISGGASGSGGARSGGSSASGGSASGGTTAGRGGSGGAAASGGAGGAAKGGAGGASAQGGSTATGGASAGGGSGGRGGSGGGSATTGSGAGGARAGGTSGGATGGTRTGGTTGSTPKGGTTGTGSGGTTTGGTTSTGGSGPAGPCDPYTWPAYSPDIDYNYKDVFPDIDPTTFKVMPGCNASVVAGTKTSGWWSFTWGKNRNSQITDAQIDQVLKGLNDDLGYARDILGWPPDKGPQNGYFSSVYLYGSSLCTDSAPNTEKGGWASSVAGYPIVLLSYYPVVNYDRGGITHEAIHCVLNSMPGGKKADWFNEGGNTWLQMNIESSRTGKYGVGDLDGAPFLAPHMPIECYSGWLQDGSFGGPNAEGVNKTSSSGQVSTWRNYLGGTQYNSAFAHFLALWVSKGSNAWIWNQKGYLNILETLASGLGEEQTRRLVMEYRARQALVDFKEWSDAFKVPINGHWGSAITAENNTPGGIWMQPPAYTASAYAKSTTSGSTVTPNADTLPGWSGANQIPITVTGSSVTVKFQPVDANMRLQLVYRASDGSAVYGQPVASGDACLRLDKAPRNGVVIAVVTATDYLYTGDAIRKKKYGYTLELGAGASATASTTSKYF